MAIESLMGHNVAQTQLNQNKGITQSETEKALPKTATDAVVEDVAINNEVNLDNTNRGNVANEVKALLQQVQEGTIEAKDAREQFSAIKENAAPREVFNAQNTTEFGNITGSLTIAQANMSQSNVARLLA